MPPISTDALTRTAKEIHTASGTADTLDAIVRSAAETLHGIDHVGISRSVRGQRQIETLAATDDLVLTLDKLQYELEEGPCVYALTNETVTRVEHAEADPRWPRFLPAAVKHGLRSMLGVRIYLDDAEQAALNLYSTSSDTLDPELEDFAELFASYASLELGHNQREDQLSSALVTRRLIGQATGIVMERYVVNEAAAFRYLTRLSNDNNVKLRDVAARIVEDANKRASAG